MRSLLLAFVGLAAFGGALGCDTSEPKPGGLTGTSAGADDLSGGTKAATARESWEQRLAGLTFSEDFDWQRVTSKSGGFSIMMPGKPSLRDAPSDSEIMCELQVGNELVCQVDRMELAEAAVQQVGGAQGVLDTILERYKEDPETHVVNSRKMTIDGYPGLEIIERIDGNGDTLYSFERHCVVGNAVVDCSWTWREPDINHPDVQTFFHSFYPH